ncbi:MAG: 1-acyl-sn-glycerol-3-phosphate acyltransferase [Acidimicrobiales bacterium]|nr:1-acyl-sn-glycerol-3-phosphate acyltransferase [Acidimicrobiales bacterium]
MPQREPGHLQDVGRRVLGPVRKFLWRIHVEGLDRLPATGPAILAPNHVSFLDSAFLMLTLPRRITFVGKAEYMDSWKTKHLFPAMGMIPIDRSGGEASEGALSAAQGVLDRGELFGIFPEGTRSRDGVLHKGHTGVARLALRAGCPIYPVGIRGTREIQPPDALVPRPFLAAQIRIGRPIKVTRYLDRASDRLVLRSITDEVMFEIRELSGQEYVDAYATKTSENLPTDVARLPGPVEGPAVIAAAFA